MKKLKKSVKALIISSVAVVCALAIVLGCVFGLKKPANPNDSNNPAQSVGFTEAQQKLASEVNGNVNKNIASFEVLDEKLYEGVCPLNSILEFGENYFIFSDGNNCQHFVTFRKTAAGYETDELTNLSKYNLVSTYFSVIAVNSKFVMFATNPERENSLDIVVVNYSEFGNPVKIFEQKSVKDESFIHTSLFGFNDNFFYFYALTEYNTELTEGTGNVYAYPLTETELTEEVKQEKGKVIENVSIQDISLIDDSYLVAKQNGGLKVIYFAGGKIKLEEIALADNLASFQKITDTKFLVSYDLRIEGQPSESDKSIVFESNAYHKFSYTVVSLNADGVTQKNISLKDGYGKAYFSISDEDNLTDSYAVFMQKVDENRELKDQFLCSYYDENSQLVIEYESRLNSPILYAGSSTFLTKGQIIELNKSVNAVTKYEFKIDKSDKNFDFSSSKNNYGVFSINEGKKYGLMDINGNLIVNPFEFSFKAYIVTDTYSIGEHTTYDDQGVPTTTYYKINLQTGEKQQINLAAENNFKTLLNSGFEGYFIYDANSKTYSFYSDQVQIDSIKTVEFLNTNYGAILNLTLSNGSKKQIKICSTNLTVFSEENVAGQMVSSFSSEYEYNLAREKQTVEISPYADLYSISPSDFGSDTPFQLFGGANPTSIKYFPYRSVLSGDKRYSGLRVTSARIKWTYAGDENTTYFADFSVGNNNYTYNYAYYSSGSSTTWLGGQHSLPSGVKNQLYSLDNGFIYSVFSVYDISSVSNIVLVSQEVDDLVIKIVFDNDGGESTIPVIYKWYGSGLSSDPEGIDTFSQDFGLYTSKKGYNFEGYYSAKGGKGTCYVSSTGDFMISPEEIAKIGSFGSMDESGTYYQETWYAYWSPTTYGVSVDMQKPEGAGDMYITATFDKAFELANPTRTGYIFSGWLIENIDTTCSPCYGNSATNLQYRIASTTVTIGPGYTYFKNLRYFTSVYVENSYVQFTALWTPISYSVTYDYGGGTIATTPPEWVNYDQSFQVMEPTKSGFSFAGWDISGMDTSEHLINGTVNKSSSVYSSFATSFKNLRETSGTVKFVAKWGSNSYNVEYLVNGGTRGTGTYKSSVSFSETLFVPKPTRVGYDFDGWTVTGMSSGNQKFYGNYTSVFYTLGSAVTEYKFGAIYTYFKNLQTGDGNTVTFSANWVAIKYQIDYNYGDEGFANKVIPGISSPTEASFDTAFVVSNPTWPGYTFTGWIISGMDNIVEHTIGTEIITGTTIDEKTFETNFKNLTSIAGAVIKFEAFWTVESYNVEYDLNAPDAVSPSSWKTLVAYDEIFYVPAPTRIGYDFNGWTITDMISGRIKYYGSSNSAANFLSIPNNTTQIGPLSTEYLYFLSLHTTGTVHFTANWKPIIYSINYVIPTDAELAENTPTKVNYDQTFTVNSPYRPGYSFNGWLITNMGDIEDGIEHYIDEVTTRETMYPSSGYIFATTFKNLHSRNDGVVIFTADWSLNNYNIEYDFGGGEPSETGSYPKTATYGIPFVVDNPKTAPMGYHFYGWRITNLSTRIINYYGETSDTEIQIPKSQSSIQFQVTTNQMFFKDLHCDLNATVLFTAVWEGNIYYINYVLTDARGGDGKFNASQPESVRYGDFFYVPSPVRTGYTFVGWMLSDLADKCLHYYNNSSSGTGTVFESINRRFVDPNDQASLFVVPKAYSYFKNLHYEDNARVTLTASWTPNLYKITYHFIPKSADMLRYSNENVNMPNLMTSTKTFSVYYDSLFTLPSMTNSEADSANVTIPTDVAILYWVFFPNNNRPTTNLSHLVGENVEPNDTTHAFEPGSEHTLTVNENFYADDMHAYAIYQYVIITLKFYGATEKNKINEAQYYSELWSTRLAKTYTKLPLPVDIGNSTTLGLTILGYMISSNRYDKGWITQGTLDENGLLTTGSISIVKHNGVSYTALAGAQIEWFFTTDLAFDKVDPVFYLYAVYQVNEYTLSFRPETPAGSYYEATGQPSEVIVASGSSYTLPSNKVGDTVFSLTGYQLTKWKVKIGSSYTTFNVGASFNPSTYASQISRYVVFYTVWEPIKYNITYQFNGGSEISGGSYPTSATFDSWFMVSVPIREGYTLTSYSATNLTVFQLRYFGASTSNFNTSDSENQNIIRSSATGITGDYYYKNLRADGLENVVFVADWTPITYSVKYVFGDGTSKTTQAQYDNWFVTEIPSQMVGYTLNSISITGMSNIAHKLESPYATGSQKDFTGGSYTYQFSSPENNTVRLYNLRSTAGTVTITFQFNENSYNVSFYLSSILTSNKLGTITVSYSSWFNLNSYSSKIGSGNTLIGYYLVDMDENVHTFGNSAHTSTTTSNGNVNWFLKGTSYTEAQHLHNVSGAEVKVVYIIQSTSEIRALTDETTPQVPIIKLEAILPQNTPFERDKEER